MTQLAGTSEYTDCISAEGQDFRNECPGYETKQSNGGVPVMPELWGMPSLPGPLCSRVVTPVRVLSMGQIGLFDI